MRWVIAGGGTGGHVSAAHDRRTPSYPALAAWWRELRAGERTRTTFDPLWAAACSEASAGEFLSIPELHDALMRDAARIIREAARRRTEQQL